MGQEQGRYEMEQLVEIVTVKFICCRVRSLRHIMEKPDQPRKCTVVREVHELFITKARTV